jgi:uncharacterized protein involved in exopolysaccharide biosynthesis
MEDSSNDRQRRKPVWLRSYPLDSAVPDQAATVRKEGTLRAYRSTFTKRWRLLGSPIVLGVVVAFWVVMGSPAKFSSSASLWVDNPASVTSSLGDVSEAVIPPAQQEQQVLSELLTTRAFVLAVGHSSSLGSWLAGHPVSGWGPSQLLKRLSGSGSSVDDRIVGALTPSSVHSTVAGPQVLDVSFSSPSPAVARSTVAAVVNQLQQSGPRFAAVHAQAAASYYSSQQQAASQAVTAARGELAAYLASHHGAGPSDPNVQALQAAVSAASGQLQQAQGGLNQAVAAGKRTGGSALQVIDQPTPAIKTSTNKKRLFAIVGGLFAGALIALLGTIALTPKSTEEREPLELLDGSLARGEVRSAAQSRRQSASESEGSRALETRI